MNRIIIFILLCLKYHNKTERLIVPETEIGTIKLLVHYALYLW